MGSYSFDSTFAGIPVVVEYEVEDDEDHRGQDVTIVVTSCLIAGQSVELCEDAATFHPAQLAKWQAEAEGHYEAQDDDGDPDPWDGPDEWAAAAAEDRWIAQRDHAHYSRAAGC